MSVVFDAVAAATGADNVTSFSWTHTPVGTPSAVGIGFSGYAGGTGVGSYDVIGTYGGVTTPRAVRAYDDVTTGQSNAILGLASPPAGAQTVVINPNGSGGLYGIAYSVTVTGSDTSTVFSNTVTGTGNSTSASVTCTTAADEFLMDAGSCVSGDGVTAGADQTQRTNYLALGVLPCFGSTQLGSNGGVMSWAVPVGIWNLCAASFKAAASGVATTSAILPAGLGSGGLTKAILGAGLGAMG